MRINPPVETKSIHAESPNTQLSFDAKTIRGSTQVKQNVKVIWNFIRLRSKKKASGKLNRISVATNVNYSSRTEGNGSEIVRLPSERNSNPRQESMREFSNVLKSQRSAVSTTVECSPLQALSKKSETVHLSSVNSGCIESNPIPTPINSNLSSELSNLQRQIGFVVEKYSRHKVPSDECSESAQAIKVKCKTNAPLENSQVSSSQSLIEAQTGVVSKDTNIDGLSLSFKEKQKLVESKLKERPKTQEAVLIKQQEEIRKKRDLTPKTSVPDTPVSSSDQVSLIPGVIPPPPPLPPSLLSGQNKVWIKKTWAPVDVGETKSGEKNDRVVSAKKYIEEHKTKEMDSINDELRTLFESKKK